jgi:hypothetical protein
LAGRTPKLLVDAGHTCNAYQDRIMRNLHCDKLQVDEISSFCQAKERNVPEEKRGIFGIGHVWTFVGIDAVTKLVPSWMVGNRDACNATSFCQDLAGRLSHRVQLTTDGHRMYLEAVEAAFGGEIDFAQLVKLYGNPGDHQNPETRYSPGECCGSSRHLITGRSEPGGHFDQLH